MQVSLCHLWYCKLKNSALVVAGSVFDADAVSKYFELPDDHTVVCITAFGYADERTNAKPRKSTEELLIKK